MSDHRLRLNHHHIFPLTRRSPKSKPSIKASSHHHQASIAASILKLSKSFRVDANSSTPTQTPSVSITIRNFAISLVISPSHSPPPQHNLGPDDRPAVVEYAIVLDCLSLWATTGPDWPLSAILPTPRCLKNSFRLLLPTNPTIVQAGGSLQTLPPSSLKTVNTFPPLRRERLRFSTPSRTFPALTKSANLSDDDLRPLSDESEPEGIGLSYEDDERNFDPRMHWVQDELHPRIEGVFQSTQDLCILLGSSNSQISSSSTSSSLSARHAQSRLSVSLQCASNRAIVQSNIVSMDLSFSVDLHGVSMQSINTKVPLVLAIPQRVAASIVSAQWSPLNGEGVIETVFPQFPSEQETHLAGSPATTRQLSISPISSNDPSPPISRNSSKPRSELDLLNTPAPFLSSKLELRDDTIQDDSDPDLSVDQPLSFSPAPADQLNTTHPEVKTLSDNLRHELVAWIDTEWLIRRAATSPTPVNSRLVINLHAQLELAVRIVPTGNGASQKVFSIPFLMLPSIDKHDCACHISGAPTDSPLPKGLDLTLPPWATVLEKSSVDQLLHVKLSLSGLHPESTGVITATFDDSPPQKPLDNPIVHESIAVQSPSTYQFPHTEPNLSIQTLIINPTRRVKHLSRKSTITPITIDRRRSRLSESLKSRLVKQSPTLDKETLTRPTEVRSRIQPRIQSVQIESVINRSSGSQPKISQYVEMSITFFLPSKNGKPYLNLNFPVLPGGSFEVLGAWIGGWELTQDHDFEIFQTCQKHEDSERPFHSVAVELTSGGPGTLGRDDGNCMLPNLQMIVKSEIMVQPQGPVTSSVFKALEIGPLDSFLCTVPSFDIPVAVYRVSLQSCAGFQIELKEANMLVLESSMHKLQLIQYSLPVGSTPHTSVSMKPTNSSPPDQLDLSLSPIISDSKQVELPPCSSELARETSGPHVEHSPDTLSLYEKYAIKWGMNWKTLLLCWLIYLVSSMGIQLDQISARLGRMEAPRYSPDEQLVKGHPSGEIHSSIESTGDVHEHEVQSGDTLTETDRGSSSLPDLQEWKRSMLRSTLLESYGQEGSSVVDRVRNVFVREKIQRIERPSGRTDHWASNQRNPQRGDDHYPWSHDDFDRRSKEEEPRQAIVKDFLGLFDRYLLYLYRPYVKFFKRINLWMGQDDPDHDSTPREPSSDTDRADREPDFLSRQSDDHHRVEL